MPLGHCRRVGGDRPPRIAGCRRELRLIVAPEFADDLEHRLRLYRQALRLQNRLPDDVAQLADVAGPRIRRERVERIRRDRYDRMTEILCRLLDEPARE